MEKEKIEKENKDKEEAEVKRIEDENKKQKDLELQERYTSWKKENEGKYDIELNQDGKKVLYKKVSEFII